MANTKVTQELIADDAIGAAQLASNAVVTASIADDAVTSAKLDTNLSVAGSLTAVGTLTANAGINVDNINIDGTTIGLSTGDLTLDVAGNIVLDANGGGVYFKDDGTAIGFLQNDGGDFRMISSVSDKDIKFLGNDGGSTITALTLDMSNSGRANFNNDIGLNDDRGLRLGSGDDSVIYNDGSNLYIKNNTSNQNIIFQGNDDGSAGTTALTLDMSAAGAATFNNKIIATELDISGNIDIDGTTNLDVVDIDGAVNMATTLLVTGIATAATSAKITQVAITSSSNAVAWNSAAAANAYHVTTENTTFSAPSNAVEGAIISVELAQGGTVRTIAWNTVFEFAASTAPTVTATANKTDIFSFRYNGSVWQEIGRVQNLAQT